MAVFLVAMQFIYPLACFQVFLLSAPADRMYEIYVYLFTYIRVYIHIMYIYLSLSLSKYCCAYMSVFVQTLNPESYST